MEMVIDFPGGARVDAHFGDVTVKTDQPPMGGGEGSVAKTYLVFPRSGGLPFLGFPQFNPEDHITSLKFGF